MVIAILCAVALPAAPEHGRFVRDVAGLLSGEEVARLEALAEEVDKAGVGQLGILVTGDLYGRADRKELASDVFKEWGIGHKRSRGRDDGVLILLKAMQPERGVKIEVGYDMEGRLNDGKVGAMSRAAVPSFQAGAWGAGLHQIASAIAAEMHAEGAAPKRADDDVSTGGIVAVVMGGVLLALSFYWFMKRKRKKAEPEPTPYVSPVWLPASQPYTPSPYQPSAYPPSSYTPPARRDPEPSTPSTSSSWSDSSSSSDSGSSDSGSSWGGSSGGSDSGGGGFDGGSSGGGGSDTDF